MIEASGVVYVPYYFGHHNPVTDCSARHEHAESHHTRSSWREPWAVQCSLFLCPCRTLGHNVIVIPELSKSTHGLRRFFLCTCRANLNMAPSSCTWHVSGPGVLPACGAEARQQTQPKQVSNTAAVTKRTQTGELFYCFCTKSYRI